MGLPGIGVFGVGTATADVVPYLKRIGYSVNAIWDQFLERAKNLSENLDIPFYTDQVDNVLLRKDVDLVLILSPPLHQSEIAVKALGIGKHVAVQPPGGLYQKETLRMLRAAQYYPSLNSVILYNLRFLPQFISIKNELSSGFVGNKIDYIDIKMELNYEFTHFSWEYDEFMGGGVLFTHCTHLLDLIYYLTNGKKASRVQGMINTFVKQHQNIKGFRLITADDHSSFQMELPGGLYASISVANHLLNPFSLEVKVFGNEGILTYKNGVVFGKRNGDKTYTELKCENAIIPKDHNDMYSEGTLQAFKRLRYKFENPEKENQETFATFEDALYIQATVEAVRTSWRDKCWTKVSVADTWK